MSPPGLQCPCNEITLKEQTSVSPQSWNKAPTAVSHHHPNMPSLGLLCAQQHFRKICEDFRYLLLRSDAPKARGCHGGQWLHLEQVMESTQRLSREWVQRLRSASHTAQEIHSLETAPGPSQEAQESGPGLGGGDRRPDAGAAALQLQFEISSSIFTHFTHFTTFLFC